MWSHLWAERSTLECDVVGDGHHCAALKAVQSRIATGGKVCGGWVEGAWQMACRWMAQAGRHHIGQQAGPTSGNMQAPRWATGRQHVGQRAGTTWAKAGTTWAADRHQVCEPCQGTRPRATPTCGHSGVLRLISHTTIPHSFCPTGRPPARVRRHPPLKSDAQLGTGTSSSDLTSLPAGGMQLGSPARTATHTHTTARSYTAADRTDCTSAHKQASKRPSLLPTPTPNPLTLNPHTSSKRAHARAHAPNTQHIGTPTASAPAPLANHPRDARMPRVRCIAKPHSLPTRFHAPLSQAGKMSHLPTTRPSSLSHPP
eukprot:365487-Chlamydomonas_euryale.AAC.2